MRLGHVIGRVTLSKQEAAYKGGRFLIVQPFGRDQFKGAGPVPLSKGSSLVVYDNLGADSGSTIGFTEGAEATAPFADPTPVDAFNAAIIDRVDYRPPAR